MSNNSEIVPGDWERKTKGLEGELLEKVQYGLAEAVDKAEEEDEPGLLQDSFTDDVKEYMQDLWNSMEDPEQEDRFQVFEGDQKSVFRILEKDKEGYKEIVRAGRVPTPMGAIVANFGNMETKKELYNLLRGRVCPGFYIVGKNQGEDGDINVAYAEVNLEEEDPAKVEVLDPDETGYLKQDGGLEYDFETFGASAIIDPRLEGIQVITLKEDIEISPIDQISLEGTPNYRKSYSS